MQLTLAALLVGACTSPHLPVPVKPESEPPTAQSQPQHLQISQEAWKFNFQNEAHTYTSTTQTTFQSDVDSLGASDTLSITLYFTT